MLRNGHTLAAEVAEHMAQRVRDRATVYDDPFPHLTVPGLFPEDFYEEMLGCMPDPTLCAAIGRPTADDARGTNRLRFGLQGPSLQTLPARSREVWQAARDALASEAFREAIYTQLADGLAYRYGCAPHEAPRRAPGFALPEVYRERSGYSIAPHPDTRKKVVTMQVALTPDDSQDGLGTDFYRRSFSPAAWTREPRGFETAKSAPFRRNTASAFVVLNTVLKKSWHGKVAIPPQPRLRDSILNIWYASAADVCRDGADSTMAAA
jgi:hypothetical protein